MQVFKILHKSLKYSVTHFSPHFYAAFGSENFCKIARAAFLALTIMSHLRAKWFLEHLIFSRSIFTYAIIDAMKCACCAATLLMADFVNAVLIFLDLLYSSTFHRLL
jgi:hypothetical protein